MIALYLTEDKDMKIIGGKKTEKLKPFLTGHVSPFEPLNDNKACRK